ncbi:MAG: hypothetical protein AAGA30_08090, partial [Planctomycetota bacterium]
KIYEINTFNFYRKYKKEIDTDINLDGLLPNFERTVHYDEDPAVKVKRRLRLDELQGQGVFVVDFIGGGQSSRALIRKGRLSMIGSSDVAGQVFYVVDQDKNLIENFSIRVAENQYESDESGLVTLPFSAQPREKQAIITTDGFSCLQTFRHLSENYTFDSGIYVDRESLLVNQSANVILRPSLKLAGIPTTVKLLSDVELSIQTKNKTGVSATKRIGNLKVSDLEETVCQFVVPPELREIEFLLTAKVETLATGEKRTLRCNQSFRVNEIDSTDEIQDLHLVNSDQGYWLEVRGKSGEVRANQAVRVRLKHAAFKNEVNVDLQSDDSGRVILGNLAGIQRMTANLPDMSKRTWNLRESTVVYRSQINVVAGQTVELSSPDVPLDEISLLEKREGQFVAEHSNKLTKAGSTLRIKRLPPGSFELRYKESNRTVAISVFEGKVVKNFVLGDSRQGELRNLAPMTIGQIDVDENQLIVRLKNADDSMRVHVVGSRFVPRFDLYSELSKVRDVSPWTKNLPRRTSSFVAGRQLSDEYRYILNRRYQDKYVGNMLRRPSLLLNPWSVKEAVNNIEQLSDGGEFGEAGADLDSAATQMGGGIGGQAISSDFANLDFMKTGSTIIANLKPVDGAVKLDLAKLNGYSTVKIVAVGAYSTASRELNLSPGKLELNDLRLADPLDSEGHMAQVKKIDLLKKGDKLIIEDLAAGQFHLIDDLSDAFQLFRVMNPSLKDQLSEFEFLMSWSEKSDEEQESLYSKFACHEFNFYLYQKDQPFFERVVKPHISNKAEFQLVDRLLTDKELDRVANSLWSYGQSNIFERILISQKLESLSDEIRGNLLDIYMHRPIRPEGADSIYDRSIRAGGLASVASERLQEQQLGRKNLPSLTLGGQQEVNKSAVSNLNVPKTNRGLGAGGFGSRGGGGGFGGGGRGRRSTSPQQSGQSFYLEGKSNTGKSNTADFAIAGFDIVNGEISPREKFEDVGMDKSGRFSLPMDQAGEEDEAELLLRLSVDNEFNRRFLSDEFNELTDRGKNLSHLYRRLEPTKEWIEQQYYHVPLAQQRPQLVPMNRFWLDYSRHEGGPFLSSHIAECHRTLTEMLLALSVIDLPEKAGEHQFEYDKNKMELTAAGPMVAMHQQFRPVKFRPQNTQILISENFYQKDDRYRTEDGVRFDKFINGPFVAHTLYGAQVVLTNPTSTPQIVDLLTQVPEGAVPTSDSQITRSVKLQLDAFSTKTFDYFFYFPTAGKFSHYPAHASRDEQVLAVAEGQNFQVEDRPIEVDRESWNYVSQNGSEQQVLDYLRKENLEELDLKQVAFRMKSKPFFEKTLATLKRRFKYDATLWAYGVKHRSEEATKEFLRNDNRMINAVGLKLESPLLTADPYQRQWYQHREYSPLVNARIHSIGNQRTILNPTFLKQYQ